MTRLVLVDSKRNQGEKAGHRSSGAAFTEGEVAKRLLEAHGYLPRRQATQNGQWEFPCPFHEEEGTVPRGKGTNFYLSEKTSQYFCQAGACGEQGNLQTLERYFGVDSDPTLSIKFKSKDKVLQQFQANLTADRAKLLIEDKGLSDEAIHRFRIGYDTNRDCYVIPYLEGRRPVAFRFYDPTETKGPNGAKYWWERSEDTIVDDEQSMLRLFNPGAANGDTENGRVFVCEGEFKAMLLAAKGYAAVSIPGVHGFKQEWARYFMHAKEIIILLDNDDPQHLHNHRAPCRKCETVELADCAGHNPGQEAAVKLLDFFGFRARNVVLPLVEGARKTDINEYMMRDGNSFADLEKLVRGIGKESPFLVRTLAEIRLDPPPESVFLVSHGLLPRGGRLLVTGAPKVGKSIFIETMVLSIASGLPFLRQFEMANDGLTPGHRVLILDRELSERSLYDRFNALIADRRGYSVAEDKLLIDHKFRLQLDTPNAANNLKNLVLENNAEVVVLDTAYKFFTGDMENAKSVAKAFATIDEVIMETGVSVILTHHHRKGGAQGARLAAPDADQVMGSFLWTGWPNGTVLLNFKNRSVSDPYTTIASFVAFRDAPAPDPLLLKRAKDSISYREILPFSFEDFEAEQAPQPGARVGMRPKLTYAALADLLMQEQPVTEEEFMHASAAHFGVRVDNIKLHLLDIADRHPDFVRDGKGTRTDPYVLRYRHDRIEETYEQGQAALRVDGQLEGQTSIEDVLA